MSLISRVFISIVLGILLLSLSNYLFQHAPLLSSLGVEIAETNMAFIYLIYIVIDLIIISLLYTPVGYILQKFKRKNWSYLEVIIIQITIALFVLYKVSFLSFSSFNLYSFYTILSQSALCVGLVMVFNIFDCFATRKQT